MGKASTYLRLISFKDPPPEAKIAVIASITQIEVAVPWYLRAIAACIENPYMVTMQDFSDEYQDPLHIPTSTQQCNSFQELRAYLKEEQMRVYNRGKLVVVDYTHKLGVLALEFNI